MRRSPREDVEMKSEYATNSFERSGTQVHDHLPVFTSSRYLSEHSYLHIASDKLARAAEALRISEDDRASMVELLGRLCSGWSEASAGRPRYYSNVSLEGFPFELSYAWGGERQFELRMSFETLADPPSPAGGLAACRRFTHSLPGIPELAPEASIAAFTAIEDLVTGPSPQGMAPMAHGVAWSGAQGAQHPAMKIYLNPNIDGFEHGLERTAQCMDRLGVGRAWSEVLTHLRGAGSPQPVPVVIALDLRAQSTTSRVKVYLPHVDVCAESIDRQAAIASGHVEGSFVSALQAITQRTDGKWDKAPVTCLTLASAQRRLSRPRCTYRCIPTSGTTPWPVSGCAASPPTKGSTARATGGC